MAKEQAVWGVHITGVQDDAPITGNYVAIGWHEMGDVAGIAPTRDVFKAAYAKAYPNAKAGTIPVSAGSIFRFLHEMKIGDVIVYPSRHDRMIHIGRVAGDYYYVPTPGEEYPQRRKVEWVCHIGRDKFPQSALYEIGSAITLFRISTHADIFLAALAGEVAPSPETDDATAAAIAEQFEESTEDFIIKRLKDAQSPHVSSSISSRICCNAWATSRA